MRTYSSNSVILLQVTSAGAFNSKELSSRDFRKQNFCHPNKNSTEEKPHNLCQIQDTATK